MPTYQYACTACGDRLEVVQSFSDDPLTVCPTCEGRLRKVFSAVGVVFKGSGFYKTDSRAKEKVGAGATGGDSAGGDATGKDGAATKDGKADKDGGKAKTEPVKAAAGAGGNGAKPGSAAGGPPAKSASTSSTT